MSQPPWEGVVLVSIRQMPDMPFPVVTLPGPSELTAGGQKARNRVQVPLRILGLKGIPPHYPRSVEPVEPLSSKSPLRPGEVASKVTSYKALQRLSQGNGEKPSFH